MENRLDRHMAALQERIAYRFDDPRLLLKALTHKSFTNENPDEPLPCNERLEFLGDAVLDLVISQRTFHDYPHLPEGELTRIRAELVRERNLADVARGIELGECLRLGRGERRTGGDDKDSLLANTIEAVFGAIFLDGGFGQAQSVIEGLFREQIRLAANHQLDVDHKTRLQELCQRAYRQTPVYILLQEEGPDHQRHYTVEVRLGERPVGVGKGRSKKMAEQDAARSALTALEG